VRAEREEETLQFYVSAEHRVSEYQYRPPLSSLLLTSPEEGDLFVPVK